MTGLHQHATSDLLGRDADVEAIWERRCAACKQVKPQGAIRVVLGRRMCCDACWSTPAGKKVRGESRV